MKSNLKKFRSIKILLFDFEGVIIDKAISDRKELIFEQTKNLEKFVDSFHQHGYKVGVITARSKDEVTDRLNKIRFDEFFTSSFDKVTPVNKMLAKQELSFEELLYIGDDILDIPLLQKAGLAFCPADAKREVRRITDVVCKSKNGESLLSEILNIIEESKTELV